jgi:hypothetical protein
MKTDIDMHILTSGKRKRLFFKKQVNKFILASNLGTRVNRSTENAVEVKFGQSTDGQEKKLCVEPTIQKV